MVESLSVTMARSLDSLYYPPVASVFLGFRSSQFGIPVDGFGYLVPAKENRTILGTIWSSTIFPNRAPEGYVALTTFVGGSRQPAMLDRDDDALVDLVVGEIQSIMGTKGAPLYTKVIRWNKAIPQYDLGHEAIMRAIDDFENAKPGVFICSNYRGGISIGDCMMSAKKIADRILAMTGMAARQPRAAAAIG
jgi:oxygen-dependent protoporphyrinogen oxidase